ncbi:MAG: hypothetical protein UV53_C0002G0011 [Candidatus Azambacteria bacterium GW2011_GWE1_42_9]|nr:MAG: hypothetical protein UV53_C0002G0011 [Candidatus Azambacteria bacterium GW2011_GWE1_42_9]KKT03252.1 MAG: hypothetical protein UV81_C0002G0005 [Candidatus Azambacteria bacterium GW2011_GWD1_43_18]KKT17142.1 MAG: hypothetical protein UV99_C0001G0078 [Parcubacteria group bacterium GW2011_GWC1_43_61]OGD41008.1 MAG: hypothetical protein A3K28_00390 [Candidatus Azambacteria bacterium RIFOXYB1_FULL_40_33]OGD42383.1 MAG: hypothetical protein A2193_00400 [Candidatus Azambacteria bacterium RIFOXY
MSLNNEILLLLFLFTAVFLYGLIVGRNRIIVLLLASYPATLINEYIPYQARFLSRLNFSQGVFLKSFSFFVFTLFIFWILVKSGFSRKELNKKTWQIIFLSLLCAGFWVYIILSYSRP